MRASRMPITVIYGLPGAGKTAVADHLSACSSSQRIGVSQLTANNLTFEYLNELVNVKDTDYVLLEAGGACDPERLAAHLTPNSRTGAALAEHVLLDTMVAVIDTSMLVDNFCSWDLLADRNLAARSTQDRAVVEVLAEQIEFADVVVLNKIDCVLPDTLRNAALLVRALNPEAVVLESRFGRISPDAVLFTDSFDFMQAQGRARWVQVLSGVPASTTDSAGVSAFLYQARRPFHPQRLMRFVRSEWQGSCAVAGFFGSRRVWTGWARCRKPALHADTVRPVRGWQLWSRAWSQSRG
jgi:G3E family GTPase